MWHAAENGLREVSGHATGNVCDLFSSPVLLQWARRMWVSEWEGL